ncbi:hypothetical protein BX666DRAFT_1928091 [Dichotomocladium elegans]|nr:hypothetical protein BX666DRAFT_1928091 [Dichotomocladium elegans]
MNVTARTCLHVVHMLLASQCLCTIAYLLFANTRNKFRLCCPDNKLFFPLFLGHTLVWGMKEAKNSIYLSFILSVPVFQPVLSSYMPTRSI